jgi:hypothetical protein
MEQLPCEHGIACSTVAQFPEARRFRFIINCWINQNHIDQKSLARHICTMYCYMLLALVASASLISSACGQQQHRDLEQLRLQQAAIRRSRAQLWELDEVEVR